MEKQSDKQFWKQQIKAWKESGLPIKKFCKKEGLIEHRFYYWRKALSKESTHDFIQAVDQKSAGNFKILFNNGMALSFDSLPDACWLAGVIKILGEHHDSQFR